MPRIILDPVTVARCLAHTTPAEDAELRKITEAAEASGADEVEVCARVSEWLMKRFPQLDISIRRSAKATTN